MKKTLMMAAGLAATFAAAPAFAGTGYVGASYVDSSADTPLGDVDSEGWGVDGAVAFKAGSTLGVTLDLAHSDSDGADATAGSAHLWGDINEKFRIGGFVGLADIADNNVYSVGAEAEKHLSNVTFAAALAYANADDIDTDGWGVDGQARFFPANNIRLQGNLGWASLDVAGFDADVFTVGAGGEWQPSATLPISVFADYNHGTADDIDVDTDTFRIGGRFNFGGDLKARDAAGAGLAGLSSLANLVKY